MSRFEKKLNSYFGLDQIWTNVEYVNIMFGPDPLTPLIYIPFMNHINHIFIFLDNKIEI